MKLLITNRFASKNVFQKATRWSFSRISVQKNLPDAILVFGRHIGIESNFLIFPENMIIFYKNHFTEWKNLYSLIFAKFLKIKRQKSAILDCAAILKDFERF
jgi:hypothetical protein